MSLDDDDDVFLTETSSTNPSLEIANNSKGDNPSPTGYRGYQPPEEVLRLCQTDKLEQQKEVVHKTILLGDSGVGKTSLLVQFDTGMFQQGNYSATVGIGFTNKTVTVDGEKVKLQIWDTAGQERFRSVTHAYYRDAHALLLLYDITSSTSFDNIRAWLAEIREYSSSATILLLGNKCDCASQERKVKKEEGERVAREQQVLFMETSAKTGANVERAFMTIARALKQRTIVSNDDNDDFRLNDTNRFNIEPHINTQSCPPCQYN